MKTLDVGCGPQKLPGAIGIDHIAMPGIDIVHDLNQSPWPLKSDEFNFIRCQHVIEHISNLKVLAQEMWRVGSNGTKIDFITPHYSSYASWGDPTHLYHFALSSIPHLFNMVLGAGKFRVLKNEIKFSGSGLDFFGWLIYKVSPKKYEKHFAWIFPANEIHTIIELVK